MCSDILLTLKDILTTYIKRKARMEQLSQNQIIDRLIDQMGEMAERHKKELLAKTKLLDDVLYFIRHKYGDDADKIVEYCEKYDVKELPFQEEEEEEEEEEED